MRIAVAVWALSFYWPGQQPSPGPPNLPRKPHTAIESRGEPAEDLARHLLCGCKASTSPASNGPARARTCSSRCRWPSTSGTRTLIRLPLAQDRWFGRTKEQHDSGTAYRKLVQEVVQSAAAQRCYVLLDLHWSDAGAWGQNIGQHWMPDDNSVAFWEAVASGFANHPAVLFEPVQRTSRGSWEVWRAAARSEKRGQKGRRQKSSNTTRRACRNCSTCAAAKGRRT